MIRGFPLQEIDNWNTGSLIDWALEHDRQKRVSRGEVVKDDFERYQTLKSMEAQVEELHAKGKIREAKYKAYRESLAECARKLGE